VGAMRGDRCAGRRGGRDAGVATRLRRGCRGTSRGRRIRRFGRRETGVVDVRLELGPGSVLGYRWGNECNTARADGGEGGRGVAGISTAQRRKRRKQDIHEDAQQEEERRDGLEGCWSV
jgi:hypothetical protein